MGMCDAALVVALSLATGEGNTLESGISPVVALTSGAVVNRVGNGGSPVVALKPVGVGNILGDGGSPVVALTMVLEQEFESVYSVQSMQFLILPSCMYLLICTAGISTSIQHCSNFDSKYNSMSPRFVAR